MDNIPNGPYFSQQCSTSQSKQQQQMSFDSFGRLRVSNPLTLFDSQNRYKQNDKFYSNVMNGGTVTYLSSESTVLLNVASTTDSFAACESRFVFNYQPGKSLLILNTFVMNSPKNGLVQRVGYFGTDNGYFFQSNGNGIGFVERSNGVDTTVSQSSWNGDRLDGNGPSRIVLDVTKTQILIADIEWLGVGSVRMGFVIDGKFILAHTFNHANYLTKTYMATACLPVRYEIKNTDGSEGTLKQICSTVISEGGYEPKDRLYCAIGPTSGYTVGATLVPVCSIRLAPNRLDAIALMRQVNVAVSTNNDLAQWQIVLNGTLTGATWAASTGGSTNVQVDTAASAISGGTNIQVSYAQTGSIMSELQSTFYDSQIGRNSFTQTSDVISLCIIGLSMNPKVFWSITWSESI